MHTGSNPVSLKPYKLRITLNIRGAKVYLINQTLEIGEDMHILSYI